MRYALFVVLIYFGLAHGIQAREGVEPNDKVVGEENAPIVFIELSSLSCPHCATFHKNILPKLMKEYVETGKMLYIMRDFPSSAPALSGAMLANCSSDYHEMLGALFDSQESWAFKANYMEALKHIAKLSGMEEEDFDNCMNNKSLEDAIYKRAYNYAKTLKVYSTPTFLINGQRIEGLPSYYKLKTLIDDLLEKQK